MPGIRPHSKTLGKNALAYRVAQRRGLTPDHVRSIIVAFFEEIELALLAGDKVVFRGYFSLEPYVTKPRGRFFAPLVYPSSVMVRFRLTARLRAHLNGRISCDERRNPIRKAVRHAAKAARLLAESIP